MDKPEEPRLRALCDLRMADARARAGWHGYDGLVQDLSPAGVRSGLSRVGVGSARTEPHDEAHLAAFEQAVRVSFGDLDEHRWNPRVHIANLDLGVYERPYAPHTERLQARRRHLDAWPDAVDAARESLDAVPSVVADAVASSARGLIVGVDPDEHPEAVAAHARLLAHLRRASETSTAEPALGGHALACLLGAGEATDVDLATLAVRAEAERARLRQMLTDACHDLRPGSAVRTAVEALMAEHPSAEGIITHARVLADEAVEFVRERGLVEDLGGECRVVASPPTQRWATASLVWAAPYEPDGPSYFYLTPPEATWSAEAQREWLQTFSYTTLPATAVHEVAPGHFTHGRYLRRARSDVRRTLHSPTFVEGWAHYGEELCVEEGLRAGDPRFVIGVAMKALLRVVRFEVAIGVHTGGLTEPEATARFEADAYLETQAARAEARRATFDPTYGRYTWGKLALRRLREQARQQWGSAFSLRRFHQALLDLGAPPLGLAGAGLGSEGNDAGR